MWKNFLLSMGLLAIALAAALYSSGAANDGRIEAAAFAAGTSLILALWVSIRFVPRLARGVRWAWIPGLHNYKLTRDGGIFLIGLTIVVFAAANTSNNLLYMVLSLLIAVLLLSVFLLELNFKLIEAEATLPDRCTAGEPFTFSLRVFNRRRVFPIVSLRVEPVDRSALQFPPLYCPAIDPLTDVRLNASTTLLRRGRARIGEVRVVSRFPFGLLSRRQSCRVNGETLCYPPIVPRDGLNLSILDDFGTAQRPERGAGSELHTIRDYQSSDSVRDVHWKASAKTASLKTREYAAEESRRVVLALDRYGASGDENHFDDLVSHTASLAYYSLHEGADVELVSDEWRSPAGSLQIVLEAMMEYLATVEMSDSVDIPDVHEAGGALLLSLRPRHGG